MVLKTFEMPRSFNKIWIHAIWATKERMPLIHPSIEQKLPRASVSLVPVL